MWLAFASSFGLDGKYHHSDLALSMNWTNVPNRSSRQTQCVHLTNFAVLLILLASKTILFEAERVMERTTGLVPSDCMIRGVDFLEKLRSAATVSAAFGAACEAVREFAPSCCVNLWMLDESRKRICLARSSVPSNPPGSHVAHPGFVKQDHELRILFDRVIDCNWIPAEGLVREKPLLCPGSAGLAYLRLNTSDNIPLLFTACVPDGIIGDFTFLPVYFKLLGQGLLQAIERIRVKSEYRLLSDIAGLAVGQQSAHKFFDQVATRIAKAFGAKGCSIFIYDNYRDVLTLGGTTGLYKVVDTDNGIVRDHKIKAAQLTDLKYGRGEGITGWIFSHKKVVRLYDAFSREELLEYDFQNPITAIYKSSESPEISPRTFLGVPIFNDHVLVGVIRLHGKSLDGAANDPKDSVVCADESELPAVVNAEGTHFLPSDEMKLLAVSEALGRSMSQWSSLLGLQKTFVQSEIIRANLQLAQQKGNDLEASLQTIVAQGKQLLKCSSVSIAFLDELPEEQFMLTACSEFDSMRALFDFELDVFGRCRESRMLLCEQIGSSKENTSLDQPATRSIACIPVVVGPRFLGVLIATSDRENWFTEESPKCRVLERLAGYVAHSVCRESDQVDVAGNLSANLLAHQIKDDLGALQLGFSRLPPFESLPLKQGEKDLLQLLRSIVDQKVELWKVLSDTAIDWARPQPLFLSDVIESAQFLFNGYPGDKDIKFSFQLAVQLSEQGDPGYLVALDLLQLYLIISNLIDNSVEAIKVGGEIFVSTCVENDRAVIVVSDNGVGMNLETRNKLFNEQVSSKGRNGKGCLLVKRMVMAHGGSVCVAESSGGGTSVEISFPISQNNGG
jgi:hypothetical protein